MRIPQSLSKRAELTKLERECCAVRRRIIALRAEIYGDPIPNKRPAHHPPREPFVSDHALVRYLERVHRLNLEPLRRRILTADVIDAMTKGSDYVIRSDYILCLDGKAVLTVLLPEMASV